MTATQERAVAALAALGHKGATQRARVRRLAAVLEAHPDARLVRCGDESTGQRFGRAACRRGRAAKIGSTTPARGHARVGYQLWAVW